MKKLVSLILALVLIGCPPPQQPRLIQAQVELPTPIPQATPYWEEMLSPPKYQLARTRTPEGWLVIYNDGVKVVMIHINDAAHVWSGH